MPDAVELTLKPSAPNSLSWSVDGELAIAGGPEVFLLLPKRPTESEGGEWERLYFEAASFTQDEWAMLDMPAGPADDFFLAREQRVSEVIGVGWSPPGLAAHDRCVIAVLKSNGYLSVMAPGPHAQGASSWTKIAILAHTRPEYPSKDKRVLTVDGQIRAFHWVPAEISPKPHFRLVAVTAKSVYVIRLSLGKDSIIRVMEAKTDIPFEAIEGSLQDEADAHQFGCYLHWLTPEHALAEKSRGPQDTKIESSLLLTLHGHTRQITLVHDFQDPEKPTELNWSLESFPSHGPTAVSDGHCFYMRKGGLCSKSVPFLSGPESRVSTAISSLEGWDPAIGMAPFARGVMTYQIVSLASFSDHQSKILKTAHLSRQGYSHLWKQIQKCRQEYADDNDLGNRTVIRMHGMATYTDRETQKRWLAACITLGPSDVIQYKLRTNERATIVFTHEDLEFVVSESGDEAAKITFPWCRELKSVLDPNIVHSATVDLLPKLGLKSDSQTQQIALLHVFAAILLQAQSERLKTALKVLKSFDSGAWERAHGTNLVKVLQQNGDLSGATRVNSLVRITSRDSQMASILEWCVIPGCGEPLGFVENATSLDEAVCLGKGHQYSRCALTLIAIQQPYIRKQCERCDRSFFDQSKVPGGWDTIRKILSHSRQCVYCDGKFV